MGVKQTPLQHLRNVAIIAHIDHGKSTLADRFIQECGGLSERDMKDQVLDSMEIERERGITIKAQSVTLEYSADDGNNYVINFIDTPGHVDFSYEVSRSLNACEGAVLLVDASQGVEAQTLATTYTAVEQGVEMVPVLNKIDLPQAEPERVTAEIEELVGLPAKECLTVSAKKGTGVHQLLEALIVRIPAPHGDRESPLRALIIDSWFDNYMGVVSLVRVMEGRITKGSRVEIASKGTRHRVEQLGVFTPQRRECDSLDAGEVGYVSLAIKDIKGAPVGDTVTDNSETKPLPGFRRVQPRIFAGLFPVDGQQFPAFRECLGKLALNDASLTYEPIQSSALGSGFRVGLLGLLHLDIVRERLEREYGLNLVATAPTVIYQAQLKNGKTINVESPEEMPSPTELEMIEEPIANTTILLPNKYLGAVLELCERKRGIQKKMLHQGGGQVSLEYEIPLSELMTDFFDKLSSASSGFASMDYKIIGYQQTHVVKVDILINGEPVDAMSRLIYKDRAEAAGRHYAEQLKEIIPRQLFVVAIQAAVGGKIIARSTVSAMGKNVTAKCYGGDITRKKKLLEKQKKGKKRMKQIGKVTLPSAAFATILGAD